MDFNHTCVQYLENQIRRSGERKQSEMHGSRHLKHCFDLDIEGRETNVAVGLRIWNISKRQEYSLVASTESSSVADQFYKTNTLYLLPFKLKIIKLNFHYHTSFAPSNIFYLVSLLT